MKAVVGNFFFLLLLVGNLLFLLAFLGEIIIELTVHRYKEQYFLYVYVYILYLIYPSGVNIHSIIFIVKI